MVKFDKQSFCKIYFLWHDTFSCKVSDGFSKSFGFVTDRCNAVVPVCFLFCVALSVILRGASCFKVFSCSLSSCFVIPFSIVITSLGEEGADLVLPVHLIVCFVRVSFCYFFVIFLFHLVSGVGCG